MSVSLKKNIGFQTVYQVINRCIPLITAPYLSRVLGASKLGVFSFTSANVAYFTLFAMLGTVNFGTKSIAKVKEDKEARSKKFWSIYFLQLTFSILALILYGVYFIFYHSENCTIVLIQSIAIVCSLFDISWFFWGMENIKITVTVNLFFRILTVVLILLLVKKPNDLWLYTCIMLLGTLGGEIVLWLILPRYVVFSKITVRDVINQFKPNILLFIPLLAMSVYHTMDKTMLGLISTETESGLYFNADKIINIPVGIISGISTVMLPRMTTLYNSNSKEKGNKLFLLSNECVFILSTAMAMGIAAISNEFIPFFCGPGFEGCIILTIVLSPVLIIKGLSITARTQFLIPMNLEKDFIVSVVIGALTNLLANIILIPYFDALGAVIGTVLAEAVSCLWQYICIRKKISIVGLFKKFIAYIVLGCVMLVGVRLVNFLPFSVVLKLVVEILVGVVIYISGVIIYWKCTKNELQRLLLKKE